jgi:hypothetical protein
MPSVVPCTIEMLCFRDMLESNECLIFDQKTGTASTFRPTLSLGAFFQLVSVIDHCVSLSSPVGDMCSVAHELFSVVMLPASPRPGNVVEYSR